MRRRLPAGILLFVLCAWQSAQSKTQMNEVSLFFTRSRFLEMESCGCTLANGGGVVREANLAKKWRHEVDGDAFHLSAGPTFIPIDPKALSSTQRQAKARFLATAMSEIGVNAVALSLADTQLGIHELEALSKEVKWKWVSSNIRPVVPSATFSDFFQWKAKGADVIFVALSSLPGKRKLSGFRIDTPLAALARLKKKLPSPKKSFWVLASDLTPKDLTKVLSTAHFQMVLDTRCKNESADPKLLSSKTFQLCPATRGRELARATLTLAGGSSTLYSDVHQDEALQRMTELESHLEFQMQSSPQNLKEKKQREKVILELKREIKREKILLTATPDKATHVTFQGEWLGPQYDLPAGPMTELLKEYRDNAQREYSSPTQ